MNERMGIIDRLRCGRTLFDGGLGSMLIARGLPPGACPESWNESQPDTLKDIHKCYLDAGADVITTNTFGGTPSRLEKDELAEKTELFNRAAVQLAAQAIGESQNAPPSSGTGGGARKSMHQRFIAFSAGPTGKMLPPVGTDDEAAIRANYDVQFGAADAADLILIETIFDLREALIALLSAKSSTKLPVGVSLTYNKTPKGFFTMMGDRVADASQRLEEAGADLIGANCTLSSGEMLGLAEELCGSTRLPVLCQPNAGQPRLEKRLGAVYDQTPSQFAEDVMSMFDKGIHAVGGCCGTTPDFIREVSARL